MDINQQEPSAQDVKEGEISLIDILRFLKSVWKTITIFGIAGFGLSIIYLVITPKQYEATAKFVMGQVKIVDNNNNNNIMGINIEEPIVLITRFSYPTSYTPQVIAACGLQDQTNASLALSKSIKLTIPKGMPNIVELKTFGLTAQAAHDCANAVLELIKTSQAEIMAPFSKEAEIKLTDNERRLDKANSQLLKVDKSGEAVWVSYLSARDEIYYLLNEIRILKDVIIANQNRTLRLVAPIYTVEATISPKKHMVLIIGLFNGLLLGLMIALCRQMIIKFKGAH
jgi:capsular polysaccharide biosynthesis protein